MKFEIANLAAVALAVVGLAVGSSNVRAAEKDIVDTAVGAGQFKTLAAALDAAGLVATLKGPGPFTVFAPTDDAFAKLPAGTVENLLKPENKDKLIAILTYHVVPGKVMAADVVKLKNAKTVNGKMLKVTIQGNAVMINDAKVTTTDIVASNGVIHVIDAVVLPPAT
jgi:uncharacterized surface protein with fasciclin (FAS1) repeats